MGVGLRTVDSFAVRVYLDPGETRANRCEWLLVTARARAVKAVVEAAGAFGLVVRLRGRDALPPV